MRRFLRPTVIVAISLGLALGASVGLAAPALADGSGFTAVVTNAPLKVGVSSPNIDFAGTKPVGSTLSFGGQNMTTANTDYTCTGLAAGNSAWTCHYPLPSGLVAGHYSAQFIVTNPDNSSSTQVLSFVVFPMSEIQMTDPTPTSPLVGYQFSPGGVTVSGTPTGAASLVGTQILVPGDTAVAPVSCPSTGNGVGGDVPLGDPPVSSVTCTDNSLSDDSAAIATTQQGTPSEGPPTVSPDGSYGVFYSPGNSLNLPGAPQIAIAKNAAARTVTVTGSIAQNTLQAYGAAVVILDSNGGIVCRTDAETGTAPQEGFDTDVATWACTTGTLGWGSHTLTAAVEDDGQLTNDDVMYYLAQAGNLPYGYYVHGALSSATAVGTAIFAAPIQPLTPPVRDTTPNWSFTIGGDLTNVHPGDTLFISGSGLPMGTLLDTSVHSIPIDLGSVVAAVNGSFSQIVTVPSNLELGAHTIIVTASGPGITTTAREQAITLTAPSKVAGGGAGTVKAPPTVVHVPTTSVSGTDTAIAPNILTKALTPFADIVLHPNKIVSAFEIGLVLLLLAVLPAHLLNATIAEQSDRFERRFGKARMPNWLSRLSSWFRSAPIAGGIVVTLVTAILFGFADPKFGFTLASLRLILACGIALFLVGYVANALTGLIARVQWSVVAIVSTRPYGLILTIVGVLVSRVLHFSPGFLIGLILGLTIQSKSASGFAWRVIVLRSSIVLVMAIAAWIGYSTLTLGGNEGGTFGSALMVETLVAITTEGVVALLVELLPLKFLEGQRIYDHSRVLWAIFYLLTLVVFVLAVVPWEGNWDALHGSLWVWIVVLAVFAAVCVGIYLYFRNFAPPVEAEDGNEEVPLGETVTRTRSK